MVDCYRKKYPGGYINAVQRIPVYWGHYSIVEAELGCLTDLMDSGRNWSYAIDMAGSELMMVTNKEMVAELSANMGRIHTQSNLLPKRFRNRIKYRYKYDSPTRGKRLEKHDPPPFNLTIYKGAKSWRLTRTFVHFLLKHPVAKIFLSKF